MKKIILIIIAAILLSFGLSNLQTIFAGDLSTGTFPIQEILKLPPITDDQGRVIEEQAASYFATNNPIVALISRIINFAIRVIGSIAIILFIVGGFMLMFAQGNQQKLDEAKDIFIYGLIGLVVALMSYIIVIFIQSIFLPA